AEPRCGFRVGGGPVRRIGLHAPAGRGPGMGPEGGGPGRSVPMRSELVIRFDYGRVVPWVRRVDGARLAVAGPDALCFRTPVEVRGEDMSTVSEFTLEPGQRVPFVLTWFPSHEQPPHEVDADEALADTEAFWLGWANARAHQGDYPEEVHQAVLVLKALT